MKKRKIVCTLFIVGLVFGITGCEDDGTVSEKKGIHQIQENISEEKEDSDVAIIEYEIKDNDNQGIFEYVPGE